MKRKGFEIDNMVIEKCKAITSPILSIGVLTYNQVDYIAAAIDSLLIQEIDFSYEIVIADDCSTDGTREIVQAYAERYPDIIRLILQEENVGMEKNSNSLKRSCKGRYRATFEGDDYCADPFRFQKQVEFLENNPDYVAVGGQLTPVNSNGNVCNFPWGGLSNNYILEGEYTKQDFENGKMACHTGAWVAYNIFYVMNMETYERYISYSNIPGDLKSQFFILYFGKVMVFPQVFLVRRLLWDSSTSYISTFKKIPTTLRVFKRSLELQKMDQKLVKTNLDMKPMLDKMILSSFENFILNPSKSSLVICLKMYLISPIKIHHFILIHSRIWNKIKNKVSRDGVFLAVVDGFKKIIKGVVKIICH